FLRARQRLQQPAAARPSSSTRRQPQHPNPEPNMLIQSELDRRRAQRLSAANGRVIDYVAAVAAGKEPSLDEETLERLEADLTLLGLRPTTLDGFVGSLRRIEQWKHRTTADAGDVFRRARTRDAEIAAEI